MPLYIHKSKIMYRRGTAWKLEQMSYIFTCPDETCEYVMVSRTEDESVAIRDSHMLRCHPEALDAMRWSEAFEIDVPEYVTRILYPNKQ